MAYSSPWIITTAACLMAFAGLPGTAYSAGPAQFTVQDAIARAACCSRDIQIQEQEVQKANAAVLSSVSEFMPRLTASGAYTHNETVPNIGAFGGQLSGDKDPGVFFGYKDEKRVGLNLAAPLFVSGRNVAQFRVSRRNLFIQEQTLRAAQLALTYEVKRLFYGYLLAIETERITKELLDQAQSHYVDVERKYRAGTSSKFDMLQSQVQVSKIMPEVVHAKNAKELIESEFKKLLGLDMKERLSLKGALVYNHVAIDEGAFLLYANANRPDVKINALGIEAAQRNITIAQSFGRPRVDASLAYTYRSDNSDTLFTERHELWNGGVSVSIPIFDGFSAMAKVRSARAQYAETMVNKDDLGKQVSLDVRTACLDLVNAESIITSQKDSIAVAKDALRIAQSSYENGLGTNLDILDAQVSLSQIEKSLYDAMYDYAMAEALLYKIIGKMSASMDSNP